MKRPSTPTPVARAGVHAHGDWHTLDFLEHVLWIATNGEQGLPPGRVGALAREAEERLEHYLCRYGDGRKGGVRRGLGMRDRERT